ncbi:ParD-like antitoxin of type II toxin-antitoxin system [Variovorax sp. HW608]|nr:ParD-like antitoxin of type II toxin-antitoxin system [Variovorax sp. HW608]
MSRSAAQQIEYWARVGAACEAAGLTVADVARMLGSGDTQGRVQASSEKELWALKRQQQRQDLASVKGGRHSAASMSWFSGGRGKSAKLVDSPY